MKYIKKTLGTALLLASPLFAQAEGEWTLKDCLTYALQNNIQIQKNRITEEEGEVSLWRNK